MTEPADKKCCKHRVIIAHGDRLIREALTIAVQAEADCNVISVADTGLRTIETCEQLQPSLVIMEAHLPELCGMEVLRILSEKLSQTRFLVIADDEDESTPRKCLQNGAHGLIRKKDSLKTLAVAIRTLNQGGYYFMSHDSGLIRRSILGASPVEELTLREKELLQMIAEGLATKEIANRLKISPKTAETHRSHLMQKLNIHNIAGLTRHAIRLGLIV